MANITAIKRMLALPIVQLVGEIDHPEFEEASELLRAQSQLAANELTAPTAPGSAGGSHQASLLPPLRPSAEPGAVGGLFADNPELIVVAQSRPGIVAPRHVEALRRESVVRAATSAT